MKQATLDYIENAITRITTDQVSSEAGSHIAGVFGIAAQKFERFMHDKLSEYLKIYKINYNKDIRPKLSKEPPYNKLTLGMIAKCFEIIAEDYPDSITDKLQQIHFEKFQSLIENMNDVNGVWVGIKHRGETINKQAATDKLGKMRETLSLLD